jgi:uncharacterized membrane protein
MSGTAPRHPAYRLSWLVFIATLLAAAFFISGTAGRRPSRIAVHFDAAGAPTSFMTAGQYRIFMLLLAVVLPLLLVAGLTRAYSRAKSFNLPNRDYWLAPPRIAHTRSFLVAHGIWFGTLLAAFMSFGHWVILDANRRIPPFLSNQALFLGLLVFLCCLTAWLGTLMAAFRRPASSSTRR